MGRYYCDDLSNDNNNIDISSIITYMSGQYKIQGVKISDLKWNKRREHYDFGEMDWEEFWSVVNGNGPCNKQRLSHHKKAHSEGEWVRDAAIAYAKKQELVAI